MSIPESALDLVEDRLDGELDDDAWARARAEHGPALDDALTRARERRQALADLPQPDLPPTLRAAILAGTTGQEAGSAHEHAPEDDRGSANTAPTSAEQRGTPAVLIWGVPVLLAACLIVVVLPRLLQPGSAEAPSESEVARRDTAQPEEHRWQRRSPTAYDPPSDMAGAAPNAGAAPEPEPAGPGPGSVDKTRSSRPVLGFDDGAIAEAASSDLPAPDREADAEAVSDDPSLDPSELAELTRAADVYIEQRMARREATIREAELSMQMQLLVDAAGRRLLLVALHNGGEQTLQGQRNAIIVEGLDTTGEVVWRRDLPGFAGLELQPESAETLTLVLGEDLDPPAAVTQIRLSAGGQHGAPLPIDAPAAAVSDD